MKSIYVIKEYEHKELTRDFTELNLPLSTTLASMCYDNRLVESTIRLAAMYLDWYIKAQNECARRYYRKQMEHLYFTL